MSAPARPAAPPATAPATGRTRRPPQGRRSGHHGQTGWRRWRAPAAIAAVVLTGGLLIALVSQLSKPRPNGYLDPASSYFDGSHALSDILGERGFRVTAAYSPASAIAAIRRAAARDGGASPVTLLVTSPGLISSRNAGELRRTGADLVLVEPGRRTLSALAPAVSVASRAGTGSRRSLPPRCALPAARLAGPAQAGGITYRPPPAASGCYPAPGVPGYPVISYTTAGRRITVLGSGAPLTNGLLAADGNAALALNLLRAHRDIVWLVPQPARPLPPPVPAGGGQPHGPALIPWEAELVVIQLAVAVVLVAAWRSRRLGALIAERLPVEVRASETVEGHGRLYQARRARGRAATALRAELLDRVLPALGLARDAPQQALCDALAARTRFSTREISAIVFGPAPGTDDDLVRLARSLDELDREVRAQ